MFDYVDDLLRDYKKAAPDEHGTKSSAAPRNLFVVDDDCEKVDKKKAEQFHHLVAKTLFATKRARPDTGTACLSSAHECGLLTSRIGPSWST